MENMPSEHQVQKVIYVETIDAVVTGSGRFVLQDLLDGDLQADIQFEKAQVAGSAKKYNENIIKLQNLPISIDKRKTKRRNSGADFKERAKSNIQIGDTTFVTKTLASDEFVANFNLHLVGQSIMDPYITEYITSTTSLLIYAFNAHDDVPLVNKE